MTNLNSAAVKTDNKILIVDDDPSLLRLLAIRLAAAGYEVESAKNAKIALGRLESFHPQLVISDLKMEGMDGMALFEQIRAKHPHIPVIIMTAHGTIPDAINATKQGVFSFLTKPFESKELLEIVQQAIRLQPAELNHNQADNQWRDKIISRSTIMESLLQQSKQVARSDFSLLIQSQSGTGKELLAKAIHLASPRHQQTFTAINCAAIPEQLLESELFGHIKGAFTGAEKNHIGLFQAADGGTLFLDEIGDMPMSFQVKLLRTLQEREIRPVGSTQAIKVDVRIISATHKNLQQAIIDKTFREDLYYRLNVVELELPPLSERREDIPLLAQYFLSQSADQSHINITGFSQEAMEVLISATWPGNIRQLQNVVEQTLALSTEPLISEMLVKNALRDNTTILPSFVQARDKFERDYLAKLLKITAGNVSKAAKIAQRNRTEFYKLLNRHHLSAEAFREE
ncbi:sigma 54-interacting transcriptional regulator [Colwellia sp. MB02u-18]|uniref:sigma 54-interacting transcriptional regulator n=1 Tax=unclassified Colwellia TaxID=196834 RepID=UPI0015F525C6|nr:MULTISPECIES: sigma 54-interacting transcriptional regulator [unclassified Colwellia]MBA6223397.1 sigma 54-interacting transcriptional regulator [Colwellia sp. MB3u-45]MBA6267925.1 sigma 54-interacting transcriptional regulator [Colwellia sp. MB3u-43]MBA6322221.1 sigma 54-interacting transcriptional regulator [Colwellia sp. MB02u-19]MBA6323966.1 sigma 54-interacting transcriptional regulator [Colwellia sp. MB02u-18]MBA6331827.1 sigma 54-interacting transcriptional regulator [Colwellia sp. M